jgi:hypothetical protein
VISSQLAFSAPAFHPAVLQQAYDGFSPERAGSGNAGQRNTNFLSALTSFTRANGDKETEGAPGKTSPQRNGKSSAEGAENGSAPAVAVPVPAQQPILTFAGLFGLPSQNVPALNGGDATSDPGAQAGGGANPPASAGNSPAQPGNAASQAEQRSAGAGPLAFAMLLSSTAGNGNNETQSAHTSPDSPELASPTTAATGAAHPLSAAPAWATTIEAGAIVKQGQASNQDNELAAAIVPVGPSSHFENHFEPAAPASDVNTPNVDPSPDAVYKEPVRHVQLQLAGDNNQRVDVRVFDRGGELRVSVRSADTGLAQALRDHIPELTDRLEQQHFRNEIWIPRSTETSGTSTRGFHSQGGDGSAQDNPGRRQNGRQDNPPDWLE